MVWKFSLVLILAIGKLSFAQDSSFVKLGVSVGVTKAKLISSPYVEDSESQNFRYGLNMGIRGEILNFLDLGVSYVQCGAKYNYDTRLHYVSISLFPKLRFLKSKISHYIFLGPKVDFLIDKEVSKKTYIDENTKFRNYTRGLSFGIGIESKHFRYPVFLELQVNPLNSQAIYEINDISLNSFSYDFKFGICLNS